MPHHLSHRNSPLELVHVCLFYLPLWSVIVWTSYCTISLTVHVNKNIPLSPVVQRLRTYVFRRALAFTVVMLLTWTCDTVNRVLEAAFDQSYEALFLLSTITVPLQVAMCMDTRFSLLHHNLFQGLWNALVFVLPLMRKAMKERASTKEQKQVMLKDITPRDSSEWDDGHSSLRF